MFLQEESNNEFMEDINVSSRTAELIMPAYDIDLEQGEIDEVYFNRRKLDKPLQGSDGTWHENRIHSAD